MIILPWYFFKHSWGHGLRGPTPNVVPAISYICGTVTYGCKKICFQDNNFQYAGVQYKHECFCGNDAPPSKYLLPMSQCDLPCSGDPSQKCGGVWKMNVFKRGKIGVNLTIN